MRTCGFMFLDLMEMLFSFYIVYFSMCVCVCAHECEGQRTISSSELLSTSFKTECVIGLELASKAKLAGH